MARPPHSLKKEKIIEGVGSLRIMDDVGIKIHKLKHLKLHGKMLLADGVRAIVGSINLAPAASMIAANWQSKFMMTISSSGWKRSLDTIGTTRMRSILRTMAYLDLEEHGDGGAEKLGLRMDDEHAKKHKK